MKISVILSFCTQDWLYKIIPSRKLLVQARNRPISYNLLKTLQKKTSTHFLAALEPFDCQWREKIGMKFVTVYFVGPLGSGKSTTKLRSGKGSITESDHCVGKRTSRFIKFSRRCSFKRNIFSIWSRFRRFQTGWKDDC